MTYAFTQDVPIDAEFYGRIIEGLGDESPKGLVTHIAYRLSEGGLRYVDVWESEEEWEQFREERLHPVVHGLLRQVFGDELPPEPDIAPLSVLHVWQGGASAQGDRST
jgi:hypothetical protein